MSNWTAIGDKIVTVKLLGKYGLLVQLLNESAKRAGLHPDDSFVEYSTHLQQNTERYCDLIIKQARGEEL